MADTTRTKLLQGLRSRGYAVAEAPVLGSGAVLVSDVRVDEEDRRVVELVLPGPALEEYMQHRQPLVEGGPDDSVSRDDRVLGDVIGLVMELAASDRVVTMGVRRKHGLVEWFVKRSDD